MTIVYSKNMDYHLISGVNKYLYQISTNRFCSLNIYNYGFKKTYLCKSEISK